MSNAVFGKTIENVRKWKDSKLVTTGRKRNYSVLEPNYYPINFFSDNLLATEMRKTQILMYKPVHLDLPILELSKIAMYEFWYDCVKPKYYEKIKLCYMHAHSFIVYIKTDDI